ncbi:hypothetical protein [Sorangium cellulosum]|uniref:hypothetical protein n=1 Tax=Sorangium cellulosum TaxID=56 RepID=UPI001650DA26|nr:hypothetical protein [Sorangium cellulosum]
MRTPQPVCAAVLHPVEQPSTRSTLTPMIASAGEASTRSTSSSSASIRQPRRHW